MSENSTLKLRPNSPLSVNRNIALNSALSWKIWIRLEDYAESINQAFSVQFGELDTIDDLKTKIFENLNTIRWSRVNDNGSIALGFYCNKMDSEPDRFSPIQRLSTGPVDIIFDKSKVLQQSNAPPTPRMSADNDSRCCSLNTSPRVSASASPKLVTGNRLATARGGPNTGSPFLNIQTNAVNSSGGNLFCNGMGYSNGLSLNGSRNGSIASGCGSNTAPTLSPLPFSGGKLTLTNWSKKDLKHSVEQVDDSLYRIFFEPDELVITIYNELFGHLGSQTASDALLVFCNDITPKIEIPQYSTIDDAMSGATNFTSNELAARKLLNTKPPEREEQGIGFSPRDRDALLQPELETPPNVGLLHPNDAPTELVLDHTVSQLAREEGEREFQLITNEEQLRKVSQSMQDEDNPDSPKQAILLLPKNFGGNVSFNESPTKVPSGSSSSVTAIGNMGENNNSAANIKDSDYDNTTVGTKTNNINTYANKNNDEDNKNDKEYQLSNHQLQRQTADDNIIQSHAPLSEKEVGMVHPLLESDRKKGLSSPTSPLLPRNPPPALKKLPRNSSKTTSSKEKAFPGEWSATSDKVFPKINVLIVEDNVINQTILSSFLRKHKIFHEVAKNGQEAIDIWRQGGVHLIFMDLQLPVLSGIDAAKKIRELEKEHGIGIQKTRKKSNVESNNVNKDRINAPVIIVAFTASKSQSDKKEALISGCNDYLTKPVNLHWLSNKINEWGCMQALINFDSWKEGQSRMTENVLTKVPSQRSVKTLSGNSDSKHRINRKSRSSSNVSQSKISEGLRLAP